MEKEEIETMAATKTNGHDSVQVNIDRLTDSLNQFRVESASDRGATVAELRHIQDSIKELNGLFGKVGALETRVSVLETEKKDFDKTVREWRDESIADRSAIRAELSKLGDTDDAQWRLIYIGMGAVMALQVMLTLFGPAIRAGLNLP